MKASARPVLDLPADPTIGRILIVKWSAIGDVVLASAAMEDIRQAFPDAILHLNTLPAMQRLFAHDPRFAEVIAIDVRKKAGRFAANREWLERVRAGRYDLVIDLQRTDHTRALLTLLLLTGGAPKHRLGNRGGFPYTQTPAVTDRKAHAMMQMRATLQAAGIPCQSLTPKLYPHPMQIEDCTRLLAAEKLEKDRFAVFLPGSQAAGWLKRWGVERYATLARAILDAGLVERVALVGGPDEVEDCQRIAESAPGIVNLNGKLDLLQIAPLCAHARFIVGNDTGTAHLAAAAGVPMLVLCGPTDPTRVLPFGPAVRGLQAAVPCRSCYAKACAQTKPSLCMQALTPEFILEEIRALLAGQENVHSAEWPIVRVTWSEAGEIQPRISGGPG